MGDEPSSYLVLGKRLMFVQVSHSTRCYYLHNSFQALHMALVDVHNHMVALVVHMQGGHIRMERIRRLGETVVELVLVIQDGEEMMNP